MGKTVGKYFRLSAALQYLKVLQVQRQNKDDQRKIQDLRKNHEAEEGKEILRKSTYIQNRRRGEILFKMVCCDPDLLICQSIIYGITDAYLRIVFLKISAVFGTVADKVGKPRLI